MKHKDLLCNYCYLAAIKSYKQCQLMNAVLLNPVYLEPFVHKKAIDLKKSYKIVCKQFHFETQYYAFEITYLHNS